MIAPTIYWHDYETFGTDPGWDRPAQFAGIRTSEELEIIGEPLVLYCKPANDMLPDPEACLITGITPQLASRKGVPEAHFIAAIHEQLAYPSTCGAGYNSIRFDDEVTRNCLYRNFYNPYAREWQHSNSRWDIIDLLRLARALRPDGIEWPDSEDGSPSFRLEDITRANGIEHATAHEALSDVYATIAVARLVRERIPRVFSYVYEHRKKSRVAPLLVPEQPIPVLHVSGRYPSSEGCIALVVPLARHPVNSNGIIVYDLAKDPAVLIDGSVDEIRRLVFTAREDLPAGEERLALKTVHLNKCPVVVPMKTLRGQDAERLRIDLNRCLGNWARIQKAKGLSEKLAEIFSANPGQSTDDPDLMLYSGGFFSDADRDRMTVIRQTGPDALSGIRIHFDDSRISEMLFRYRARNFPETLSDSETERWNAYRMNRITLGGAKGAINLGSYRVEIERLRAVSGRVHDSGVILEELQEWAHRLIH
ncbi:MAG: exodeoxyribonuclease I [Methylococcales bacterium]